MLRIKYQDQFLMLAPNSVIEMERSSPLFLIDQVLQEFSMPVTILYNEANAALLGEVMFEHSIKTKMNLPIEVYDAETYRFPCTLVIDKSLTNSSVPGKGNVQGYLLTGSSAFFTLVKDLKMINLELGGGTSFNFTTWDPYDNTNGFWQHVHKTWTENHPWVFIPIRNEAWIDADYYSGWMNELGSGYNNNIATFPPDQIIPFTWVVPQPRLYKVLEAVFNEVGWTIDFTGLNDLQYQKICCLNINPIKTTSQTGVDNFNIPIMTPNPTITVELRKMFSPEVSVSDFLLQHCRRYGWAPLFDNETKICYLVALKEVGVSSTTKDFTAYAGHEAATDFSAANRKFSFKNTFGGNDESISNPDFTNYTIRPSVFNKANLPGPSMEYDTSLIFSFLENTFWHIEVNNDTNQREWQRFAFNIYDEEVKNSSDTIDTAVTSVPSILSEYRTLQNGTKMYGYFLYCKIPRNKQWGIRNFFYHGMQTEIKADGTNGIITFPYASNISILPNGTIINGWSNVYKHADGTNDDGIIEYWFKSWLEIARLNAPIERKLFLPLYEVEDLKFTDIINILNQPYLISKYIEPVPYKGFIQSTLHPILLNAADLVTTTPGNTVPYVKFIFEDEADAPDVYIYGTLIWSAVRRAKPILKTFENAAGTIPKTPVDLLVVISEQTSGDGQTWSTFDTYSLRLNSQNYNMALADVLSINNPSNTRYAQPDLKYQVRGTNNGTVLYVRWKLEASADYNII